MRTRAVITLSLLLGLTVVGAGSGGWVLWSKYQSALDDKAELQSEVTTLRNGGAGLGTGVQGAAGTGTLGASTTGSGSDSNSSSGTRTMLVKDFGIKFQVPSDLTDLTYAESPPASGFLALTTQALTTAYPDCAGAGILGALFRYPKGQPLPANANTARAQKLNPAGGYDYYYLPPAQDPCKAKAAQTSISQKASEIAAALQTISEQ
jgi:hypothetical protein